MKKKINLQNYFLVSLAEGVNRVVDNLDDKSLASECINLDVVLKFLKNEGLDLTPSARDSYMNINKKNISSKLIHLQEIIFKIIRFGSDNNYPYQSNKEAFKNLYSTIHKYFEVSGVFDDAEEVKILKTRAMQQHMNSSANRGTISRMDVSVYFLKNR